LLKLLQIVLYNALPQKFIDILFFAALKALYKYQKHLAEARRIKITL